MTMRVMVMDHDGKSRRISAALAERGCELVHEPTLADVILIDHDVPSHGKLVHAEACVEAGGRAFVYPHGGGTGVIAGWDGWNPVSPILSGVFQSGHGHAEVARRYGYPHPIHDFGWTLCELVPRRITGRVENVVFAAQHPKGDGRLSDWKAARNRDIFDRLHATGVNLTVRHIGELKANGLSRIDGVRYVRARLDDFADQIAQIDSADVVVSDLATFACLAIARGVTTVMYDSTVIARDYDRTEQPAHIDLYRDYIRFPFDAIDGIDIGELMHSAAADTDLVGEWRERFVGGPFAVDVLLAALHGDGAALEPRARAKRLHGAGIARVDAGDLHGGDLLLTGAITESLDPDLLSDLAVIRWNLGMHDEAQTLLHACLAIDPTNRSAVENLAAISNIRAA